MQKREALRFPALRAMVQAKPTARQSEVAVIRSA